MKESKIEEKLKRTEAKLNKAAEEKKNLKAKMKQLAEQAENERLVSRGKILESFLKEPLVLTNDDVTHLLDLLFCSRFTQKTLSEMIEARASGKSTSVEMLGTEEFPEDTDES
ncbi:MAG: hypothetical protein IJI45_15145 [Anaerolineaceae bacterium]|nr:hypothetical protein [Anaerolineaceae bacterium]